MNILIIEDDSLKAKQIEEHLSSVFATATIHTESAYSTGMRTLLTRKFDLLILDMSMPTFTNDFYDSETSFERFAGIMILKNLKRKDLLIPTVLFTMFDDFGTGDLSISLAEVDRTLKKDFYPHFWGSVFFESGSSNWITEITNIINDKYPNSR